MVNFGETEEAVRLTESPTKSPMMVLLGGPVLRRGGRGGRFGGTVRFSESTSTDANRACDPRKSVNSSGWTSGSLKESGDPWEGS